MKLKAVLPDAMLLNGGNDALEVEPWVALEAAFCVPPKDCDCEPKLKVLGCVPLLLVFVLPKPCAEGSGVFLTMLEVSYGRRACCFLAVAILVRHLVSGSSGYLGYILCQEKRDSI